jgi:hypothetical protein
MSVSEWKDWLDGCKTAALEKKEEGSRTAKERKVESLFHALLQDLGWNKSSLSIVGVSGIWLYVVYMNCICNRAANAQGRAQFRAFCCMLRSFLRLQAFQNSIFIYFDEEAGCLQCHLPSD